MSGTCGPTSGKLFATYDPGSRSWKMWPDIGLWGLVEFSATWPRTGYLCGGRAYELPMSEPPTDVNGSSSLLPTPNAADGGGGPGHSGRDGGLNLRSAAVLLPTPSTADATGGHLNRSGSRANELLLPGVARSLLPTPTAADANGSGGNSTSDTTLTDAVVRTRMGTQENPRLLPTPAAIDGSGGRTKTDALPGAARSLLPTPRASDGEKGGPNQRGSRGDLMLPSAVHNPGGTMSPPSDGGSESWGDTLPGL